MNWRERRDLPYLIGVAVIAFLLIGAFAYFYK
ncbi:hypothetical protein ACVMGC_001020 [Bradyrhizobium barranii subsp. barranii]|nr:hypothetical protein [Bradyrhizobium japonicum]MCP1958176.1 hypothetical protein [Bradyrhizobium japonicum]